MLTVLSSMAPRRVITEACTLYGDQRSMRIEARAAGGIDVTKRAEAREAIDIYVLARQSIERLSRDGHVSVDGQADLMTSGIAVGIRAGQRRPDIRDEAAIRECVLSASSVSYSTGPSGVYLEGLFERWAILDNIRSRLLVPPSGVPVADLIRAGVVELGFQQLSELMDVDGVEVVGSLPAAIQYPTVFTGAVSVASSDPAEARNLLSFIASSALDGVRERHGMTTAAYGAVRASA